MILQSLMYLLVHCNHSINVCKISTKILRTTKSSFVLLDNNWWNFLRQGRKQTKNSSTFKRELHILTGMSNIAEQGFLKFFSIFEGRMTLKSQQILGKFSLVWKSSLLLWKAIEQVIQAMKRNKKQGGTKGKKDSRDF